MVLRSVESLAGIQVVPSTIKINAWGQRVVQKHNSTEFITLAELSRNVLKTPEKSKEEAGKLYTLYQAADLKTGFFKRLFSKIRAFFVANNLRGNIKKMLQDAIECEMLVSSPHKRPIVFSVGNIQEAYSILRNLDSASKVQVFNRGFGKEHTDEDSISVRESEYGDFELNEEIGTVDESGAMIL